MVYFGPVIGKRKPLCLPQVICSVLKLLKAIICAHSYSPIKSHVQVAIIFIVHFRVAAWLFSLMKTMKHCVSKIANLLLFTKESIEKFVHPHLCRGSNLRWGSWLWQYSVTVGWRFIMSAMCHLALRSFCRLAHLTPRLRIRCSHESHGTDEEIEGRRSWMTGSVSHNNTEGTWQIWDSALNYKNLLQITLLGL